MVRLLVIILALLAPSLSWAEAKELPLDQARLEVIFDPREADAYPNEMMLATIRGEYRVDITLEELNIPFLRQWDYVQLARDEWHEEPVNGLPTQVMERRVAFFPKESGELTIKPLEQNLTVIDGRGVRSEYVVRTKPVSVKIAPIPEGTNDWWMPLSAIEYTDQWDKDASQLNEFESAKRKVTIRALGVTKEMFPPQPDMREPWLITFKSPELRDTQLTPLGPLTTIVWEWSFNPKTGETGLLHEVQIPYFDTQDRTSKNMILAPQTISMAQAAGEDEIEWGDRFRGGWFAWLAFIVGSVGMFVWLNYRRPEVFHGQFDLRKRLELARLHRKLRSAARRQDAQSFRKVALEIFELEGKERDAQMDEVDSHLYGSRENSGAPDLRQIQKHINKKRQQNS